MTETAVLPGIILDRDLLAIRAVSIMLMMPRMMRMDAIFIV